MERSVIDRLEKVKAVVISYNVWVCCKSEENFLLTAHYCTGPERKKTHIGMPSTTSIDGVSLYLSVMEVVDNSTLEAKIVGTTSDDGGNIWCCREALKSNTPMTLFSTIKAPYNICARQSMVNRGFNGE